MNTNNQSKNALDRYQEAAGRTRNKEQDYKKELANYGLGITGEAGEVADNIKKHAFHGHDLNTDEVIKELGDVLWYVSNIAALVGVNLSEVATRNIDKLKARYPQGFSENDSINRAE